MKHGGKKNCVAFIILFSVYSESLPVLWSHTGPVTSDVAISYQIKQISEN